MFDRPQHQKLSTAERPLPPQLLISGWPRLLPESRRAALQRLEPKAEIRFTTPFRLLRKAVSAFRFMGVKTAFELPETELDPADRDFLTQIREHGWFSTRVFDSEKQKPDFTYSTGFFHGLGHSEIIVFSLPKQVSHDILWDIYRDIREGDVPKPRTRLSGIFGNHHAVFLPVSRNFYAEHLGRSRWFYRGDDFPCLQLVWPDRAGVFPWQPDFDTAFASDQPDLTDGSWSDLTT